MNEHELINRINLLEYHQKLLLEMINHPEFDFYKLIIKNGITEYEVQRFYQLCDDLNMKLEEQKAEGFIYFHPLFTEFLSFLPEKFDVKEVIQACCSQGLFLSLMLEFHKYI
jgi:hypothetical protein